MHPFSRPFSDTLQRQIQDRGTESCHAPDAAHEIHCQFQGFFPISRNSRSFSKVFCEWGEGGTTWIRACLAGTCRVAVTQGRDNDIHFGCGTVSLTFYLSNSLHGIGCHSVSGGINQEFSFDISPTMESI
jgi:hypothetical protein